MADRMTRAALAAVCLTALIAVPGCGSGGPNTAPDPGATTPPPTGTGFSVTSCLNQIVPGTGATVASLVVPDTVTVDLSKPSGFPNGRRLEDPVIDLTLAVLFLNLDVHPVDTLFRLPLNPPANDRPFRVDFPYLAPPQGNPPLSGSDTATSFNFVDQPPSAFTRVDRMGMPAVSPALVGGPLKNPFNDKDPVNDAAGEFVPEFVDQLERLHLGLRDDLIAAGLTPCSIPK
jgi:hypothetical protein